MKLIPCNCRKCGAAMTVGYEPNEFVSENLVKLTATCDLCSGTAAKKVEQQSLPIKLDPPSLPYKDE